MSEVNANPPEVARKILRDRKNPWLDLNPAQRFFVSTLSTATDSTSLDSLRVPCLNARLAFDEVAHELGLELVRAPELAALLAEAMTIAGEDTVWKSLPEVHWNRLVKLVGGLQNLVKGKVDDLHRRAEIKEIRYALNDVLPTAGRAYAPALGEALRIALSDADLPQIYRLTKSLLSDLLHHGWSLAALGEWVPHFLISKGRSFETRFDFWIRQVLRPPMDFQVTLRLHGAAELAPLGTFGDFEFTAQIAESPQIPKSFTKPEPPPAFATTKVLAVDFESACHKASEKFEGCLDRLRFTFCQNPIRVDADAVVVRSYDQKIRMQKLEHAVPNPTFYMPEALFRFTSQKVDRLLKEDHVEAKSRERLTAAARHYRIGRDCETFRDKFLNWWWGLEFLTNISGGDIGASVRDRTADVLTSRYVRWLITDLAGSILTRIRRWPEKVAAYAQPDARPTGENFVRMVRDPAARQAVRDQLQESPFLQFRFDWLADILTNNGKLIELLDAHRKRVEWHLARLYRIRCCLVHGSPLCFGLQLPAANLEFYLREVLIACFQSLDSMRHVRTLDEVYARAAITWKHCRSEIEAAKNNPPVEPALLFPKFSFTA